MQFYIQKKNVVCWGTRENLWTEKKCKRGRKCREELK